MVRSRPAEGYSPPAGPPGLSFLVVQGALVQVEHRFGDVHHRLDVLVPQLNLELPQVIGELLDQHGLMAEGILDVTTLGSNTERFMMDLAEWAEVLEAMIAQIKERVTLTDWRVTDHVISIEAEFRQLGIKWIKQQMTDYALIPLSMSPEYLQLIR